jgi:hypothetical protein
LNVESAIEFLSVTDSRKKGTTGYAIYRWLSGLTLIHISLTSSLSLDGQAA